MGLKMLFCNRLYSAKNDLIEVSWGFFSSPGPCIAKSYFAIRRMGTKVDDNSI
jgi:hypothetical protein